MDETSWQVKLAKSNINITSLQFTNEHTLCTVCYEFPYHPRPGQTKWIKTSNELFSGIGEIKNNDGIIDCSALPVIFISDVAEAILKIVLDLRKALEG